MDTIQDWLISLVSGGSIGAIFTYLFTFRSKTKTARAEASIVETKADHDKQELKKDQFDYLQETLDKYIRDYHDLEQNFRDKMRELRDSLDNIQRENSLIISEKCQEIASLKSKITYLEGIRCYNSLCNDRIKINPNKTK